MPKKSNLELGFLLLYDWLPAIEKLPGKEVKKLLLALVAMQRENKELPHFDSDLTESFARMIEPCVKRRLDGREYSKRGQAPSPAPFPPSKEKQRKEKQSKAIEERSEGERSEERAHAQQEPPAAPPRQGSALSEENPREKSQENKPTETGTAPAVPEGSALSHGERRELLNKGLPPDYIAEREVRATEYALAHRQTVFAVLLRWWQRDHATGPGGGRREKPRAGLPSSFDADEMFEAALQATYEGAPF
ncbi:MAG: hypothetical protein IJW51_06185 [Clostridia bacterium]|nr:hypothetical protein [Clostridia bacterium]